MGARGATGYVLGRGASGAAAQWWLSGGVSAANCIAAYQPIGAASLAASYVNLANPGVFDAAPGVAPTWDTATGWTFDGSTQYLWSNVVPTNNQAWSAIVRFSNATLTNDRFLFGVREGGGGTPAFGVVPVTFGNRRFLSGGLLNVSGTKTSGVLGFAGNTGYTDGVAESGTITAVAGTITRAIVLGGGNIGGGIGYYPGKIQAFAIYNATLSAAQVAAISAAMAAL